MVTIKELQELLDPYYQEFLDCDGQSRVMHYFLDQKYQGKLKYKLYFGSYENKELEKSFSPHMWIELKTKEGPARIDYKVRKWLGEDESNPHGIYLKEDYPQMVYRGSVVTERPMKKHIIDQLLIPTNEFLRTIKKEEK